MSLSKIKRFIGALDLNTFKNLLREGKKGFDLLHNIDRYAGDHDIQFVKKITDKLLENKNFKRFEKGVNIGNNVIDAVNKSKESGLLNKIPRDINQVGVDNALQKRNNLVNRKPLNENKEALNIVNRMRNWNFEISNFIN